MLTTKIQVLLAALALIALPAAVMAQGAGKPPTRTAAGAKGVVTADALVQRYLTLAGSEANAKALIGGLRTSNPFTLSWTYEVTTPGTTTCTTTKSLVPGMPGKQTCTTTQPQTNTVTETFTIDPPTGTLGFGNIDIALALTDRSLSDASMSPPNPRQLRAALVGGSEGSVQFPGILKLHADGMGWGAIAKKLGYELK